MKPKLFALTAVLCIWLPGAACLAQEDDEKVVYELVLDTHVPEPHEFSVEVSITDEDENILLGDKERSRRLSREQKNRDTERGRNRKDAQAPRVPDSFEDALLEGVSPAIPPIAASIEQLDAPAAAPDEAPGRAPSGFPPRAFQSMAEAAQAGIDPLVEEALADGGSAGTLTQIQAFPSVGAEAADALPSEKVRWSIRETLPSLSEMPDKTAAGILLAAAVLFILPGLLRWRRKGLV